MGIDNLLAFVKNATVVTTIKGAQLDDSTAAVDVSNWIYKACYSCPEVLYHRTNMLPAYKAIVNYINNYVQLLQIHNVKLTFVFDGMKLPAKKVTHDERALRKAEAKRLVQKCLAAKNSSEARKNMLKCLDITFDIYEQIVKYCVERKIDYIIAPYEADAQLAYLNRTGLCEFVITEDTDLILYGCHKIIYKLNNEGKCLLYRRERLGKCLGPHGDEVSFEKFRRMCIMSGCDYLKNIPSVGLQSAKKFFLLTKQDNLRLLLPKLATYLKAPKLSGKVTEEYINGFIDAETTFRHHIVFDPVNKRLRPLEPYPKGRSSSDFKSAGKRFHNVLARELVKGRINLDQLTEKDLDSASDGELNDDEDDNGDHLASGDQLDSSFGIRVRANNNGKQTGQFPLQGKQQEAGEELLRTAAV